LWFWNHTLKGVLSLAAPAAAASLLCTRSGPWRHAACAAPLALMGRHALVIYVGHLLVLGALDRWGSPAMGTVALLVNGSLLVIAFSVVALLLESRAGLALRHQVRTYLGVRL